MKILFLILLLVYSNQAFANCDNDKRQPIDKPEDMKIVDPSIIKVSFYDEKLEDANALAYKAFSKNGGNLGVGAIELEQLAFDIIKDGKIELCADIGYARAFETRSVGFSAPWIKSEIRSENFELCEPTEFEKKLPYYDHVCNWYKGDGVIKNLSKKNKGTRGNTSNSVIWSTADFTHKNGSELSCVLMGTTYKLIVAVYYQVFVIASFCTSDLNYLTEEKIKSIAKSIGVYGVADPPIGQRLSFHK